MKVVELRVLLCAAGMVLSGSQGRAEDAAGPGPQQLELAARIQEDLAGIRGLSFKQPVKLATRSPLEYQQHLDTAVSAMLPARAALHYGHIVRKLGLYRGSLIADYAALMKQTLGTK